MKKLALLVSFVLGACQSCGCSQVLPPTVEEPTPDASETLVPDAMSDAMPDAAPLPTCESVGCSIDQPLVCFDTRTCLCPQPDGSKIKCER